MCEKKSINSVCHFEFLLRVLFQLLLILFFSVVNLMAIRVHLFDIYINGQRSSQVTHNLYASSQQHINMYLLRRDEQFLDVAKSTDLVVLVDRMRRFASQSASRICVRNGFIA